MGLDLLNEGTKNKQDFSVGNIAKMAATETMRSFNINKLIHNDNSLLPVSQGKEIAENTLQQMFRMTNAAGVYRNGINSYIGFLTNSSIEEQLKNDNYLSAAVDYANSLADPIGQTELIVDGAIVGYKLCDNITDANAGVMVYDATQIIANPVAQASFLTAGAWNSGHDAAKGENINAVDVVQLFTNPFAQLSLIWNSAF